jgi:hypothetical protein
MYTELTEDERCVDEGPIGDWKRDARQPIVVGRRWFLHAVLGGTAGLAAWELARGAASPAGWNAGDATSSARGPAGATVPSGATGGSPVPYGTLRVQAMPALVPPGATTTVTATFTNNSLLTLDGVEFTGTVPGSWKATAVPTVIPSQVPSGEIIQVSWHVVVPPNARAGQPPRSSGRGQRRRRRPTVRQRRPRGAV